MGAKDRWFSAVTRLLPVPFCCHPQHQSPHISPSCTTLKASTHQYRWNGCRHVSYRPSASAGHREFEDYLKCGRLEHGFLRVRCQSCHHEKLVAFSCKRRGFCPSCGV